MRGEMFTTRSTRKGWDSRSKLMLGCYMIGLLLAFPTRSMCADPPLCDLGATVVEQMNLQFTAGGRIDPVVLAGSIAFVKECPASLIPAFRQFADNEQNLHRSWIEALKSGAKIPANTELREFLAVAKRSVDHDGSALLKAYLDGVFEVSDKESYRLSEEDLFEHQSRATLRQFPDCDGAECYDVSDFLLFLLGTHPAAFFRAMHADQPGSTKWLSQVGDLSFAGDPSARLRRDSIRRFLLERISKLKVPEFSREKYQCENSLREIRFRAWK